MSRVFSSKSEGKGIEMAQFSPSTRVEAAHNDGVWSVDWAEGRIVTGSLDGTMRLWKYEDGDSREVIDGAAGAEDGQSDNNKGENVAPVLEGTTQARKLGITSVALSRDAELCVGCSQSGEILFQNTNDFDAPSDVIDAGILQVPFLSAFRRLSFISCI